jgi:hypothetical protein
VAQPRKTCPGWSNEKTAMPQYEGDCFIDIFVKEANAENSPGGSHWINIEYPNSNIE